MLSRAQLTCGAVGGGSLGSRRLGRQRRRRRRAESGELGEPSADGAAAASATGSDGAGSALDRRLREAAVQPAAQRVARRRLLEQAVDHRALRRRHFCQQLLVAAQRLV